MISLSKHIILYLILLFGLTLISMTARADDDEQFLLRMLNQLPERVADDPYYASSALLYEVKYAIKRLELGPLALGNEQRSATFSSLVNDGDFRAAVSILLDDPGQTWACERFEHIESRPPACELFPEQVVPSFPQTLSFPGQIGRVNRFGYFQSYEDAVFVQHHYGETVALLDDNRRLLCSAFLVDDRTLLTAAHCACEPSLEMVFLGRNIDANVRGSSTQTRVLTSGALFYNDEFCAIHRSDGDILSNRLVDLAILEVRRPFVLPPGFRRLSLDIDLRGSNAENLFMDTRTFFLSTGFGDTDISDRGGVNNVVVQNAVDLCTDENSPRLACHPGIEFVSTVLDVPSSLQTDTCHGDSGGPIVLTNPHSTSDFVLVGVIARGIGGGSERCGRGGVYVSLYNEEILQWLANNTN